MSQLIVIEADSSVSNQEIKANFVESIDIPPESSIALLKLNCTLADDPNNYAFIPPAGTSITYALNGLDDQSITLNSVNYQIGNLLDEINTNLNTLTGFNPNDLPTPPATARPAEPYYGVSHVAQLNNNGQFTLTTYKDGFGAAGFNDGTKWVLADGIEGAVDDANFSNIATPAVGVDLVCLSKLAYLGAKMQFTVASNDPFTWNIYDQGDPLEPEYTVICQGQGALFQLKIGSAPAINIGTAPVANMVPGDQIILYKQLGNLRVELIRAGNVVASRDGVLLSDPYDQCVISINQGDNLSLDLQDVRVTYFDSQNTVSMVTSLTDALASYLGFAKNSYTYSGSPAVLTAEKSPIGSGNFSGIQVVCNRFRVKSYQGSWNQSKPSRSVLMTVDAVNNVIKFPDSSNPIVPLQVTNAGQDVLRDLVITLERGGRRLTFIGDAYAAFVLDYKN